MGLQEELEVMNVRRDSLLRVQKRQAAPIYELEQRLRRQNRNTNGNKMGSSYRSCHEMSDIVPNDEDAIIEEQETPNEFDDVPIVDEPDEDEAEELEEPWY